jgi:hypothetical protein
MTLPSPSRVVVVVVQVTPLHSVFELELVPEAGPLAP